MTHSLREQQIEQLAATVVQGMREKKARDIVTLDLRHIPNTVCDFFVICSGDSNTHVDGISGSVQEMTRKQLNDRPWHVEGMGNSEWVLLDYVNVVAHVFQREPRDYYSIERLWADAVITEHDADGTDVVFNTNSKPRADKTVKAAKSGVKSEVKKTKSTKKSVLEGSKAVKPAKKETKAKAVTEPKAAVKPKAVTKKVATKEKSAPKKTATAVKEKGAGVAKKTPKA